MKIRSAQSYFSALNIYSAPKEVVVSGKNKLDQNHIILGLECMILMLKMYSLRWQVYLCLREQT